MSEHTELSSRMIARADLDNLPANHELRTKAARLDIATAKYYAEAQECSVQEFMGCWARARRAWSDYTGEPLL